MNTRKMSTTLVVVLLAGLAAFAMLFSRTPRAAGSAEVPAGDLAVRALPASTRATTRFLTQVHEGPDAASRVVDILTPARQVSVLGRSADGWVALGESGSSQPAGYVAAGDLEIARTAATANSLAIVSAQPGPAAASVNVFTPGTQVELTGITADGEFYALANGGYIATSQLSLARQTAETALLTKVHLSASETSRVVDILTPTTGLNLLAAASPDGWVAISSLDGEPSGYVRTSDLK